MGAKAGARDRFDDRRSTQPRRAAPARAHEGHTYNFGLRAADQTRPILWTWPMRS